MTFEISEWEWLSRRIARRYADDTSDPATGIEDVQSEIHCRWLAEAKHFATAENLEGVLAFLAHNAVEAYVLANDWQRSPDTDWWPEAVVRKALPDILMRVEDWPGTAAEPAWEALSQAQRFILHKRVGQGLDALTRGEEWTYYNGVSKYSRALNTALTKYAKCSDHYRYREHEGPGSRRHMSNAQARAKIGGDY